MSDTLDLVTVYIDDEDEDVMTACDPRADQWSQDLKVAWVAVIKGCLTAPKNRFASMSDVLHALTAIEQLTTRTKKDCVSKSGEMITCEICFDDCPVEDGVSCCPSQIPAKPHFLCTTCFQGEVLTQCSLDYRGQFRGNDCGVVCRVCPPITAASSMRKEPYDRRVIYAICDNETLSVFEAAREEASQSQVLLEQEEQFARKLRDTMEQLRIAAATATLESEGNEVRRHYQHVAENILTTKCPNAGCRQALYMDQDFNSCFALKCDQCNHQCCGWCMVDCGVDAHAHVRKCARNVNGGNLFPPSGRSAQSVFLESHRATRQESIQRYLSTVSDAGVRQKVLLLVEAAAASLR